jgi:SAM-dependent methyltransferase
MMGAHIDVRSAQTEPAPSSAASPWRCPRCRGALDAGGDDALRCDSCAAVYDVVAGIPDLRVGGPVWIDLAQDRDAARRLDAETADLPIEEIVRRVYGGREGWDRSLVEHRTRQVIEAPARLRSEIAGWLAPATSRPGFVDLGCGPGQLLAAAAAEGRAGIGIDVSLVWLVVAKRLIAHYGGRPVLAAALAEALPLASASVPAVVSLDVIEHVGDQAAYLREIDRVTALGAPVALATPNRFSLAAEPHVFVWGVGWLPRPLQARYVAWRSGKSYEFTRLLGVRETRRMLRRHTRLVPEFLVPLVPREEIARMGHRRATLARAYNALAAIPWLARAFLAVGPFFRVLARKAHPPRSIGAR